MAISYPLSLPTTPGIKRVTLHQAVSVAVVQNPWTFATQVQKFAGQMWGADITLPSMTRDQAEAWLAWFVSLNGQEGTFLLTNPAAKLPRGSALGIPVVNGAGQSGASLSVRGWPASTSGLLLAGDHFSINNRLYKNLTDVASNGSGVASLDVWPALRTPIADGVALTTNSPLGTFRLSSNASPVFGSAEDLMYDFSFSCAEAL
jgi:hypothetical protein